MDFLGQNQRSQVRISLFRETKNVGFQMFGSICIKICFSAAPKVGRGVLVIKIIKKSRNWCHFLTKLDIIVFWFVLVQISVKGLNTSFHIDFSYL